MMNPITYDNQHTDLETMTTPTETAITERTAIQMGPAAPTFLVADVGETGRWYSEHLGFDIVGTFPDSEPYAYASLQRDGVEIMLLGLAGYHKADSRHSDPKDCGMPMSGCEAFIHFTRACGGRRLSRCR